MNSTLTFKTAVAFTALMALFTILPGAATQLTAAESQAQLTRKEVKTLVATARTSEDHMKLVRYFNREADQLDAESGLHGELAKEYRTSLASQAMAMKSPMSPRTAAHCEYFMKATREAAQAARELAAAHMQMAKEAAK